MNNIDIKNKKTIALALAGVCALVLVGVVGYAAAKYLTKSGQQDPPVANTDTPGANDTTKSTKTVKTRSNEMPSDLPSATRVYEGAELVTASTITNSDGKHYELEFRSDRSPEEIFAFYQAALSSNGWKSQVINPGMITANNRKQYLTIDFIGASGSPDGSGGTNFQLLVTALTPPEVIAP